MSENKRRGGYEDITSQSSPKGLKNKIKHSWEYKTKPFFLRNKKRNLKALICILLCFVIATPLTMLVGFFGHYFGLINHNEGYFGNEDASFGNDSMDENLSFATIDDIEDANSIKELLKSWATNGGEQLHSKKVINVLLIGEDDEDGTHRSDSTMLVSVNTVTKKITITSFLRDSYTYMNIIGSERYCKTNHSYGWGGAAELMEVLSNNYKIKIDKYVSINYQSFKSAVDELGGVRVPITDAEANYMNRTTRVKGFTSGDSVLLNGERALIYARIRKLDSEVERTRRQRELISSVITSVKGATLADINDAIETFLPYITTNFKKSEVLSYAAKAVTEGWMNYEIVSSVMPSEECRSAVRGFQTYSGHLDVWIVDYIKAAQELQLALYSQTNIEIDPETHISALDFVNSGNSYTSSYDDSSGYEDDYSETTTKWYEADINDWSNPFETLNPFDRPDETDTSDTSDESDSSDTSDTTDSSEPSEDNSQFEQPDISTPDIPDFENNVPEIPSIETY